MYVKGLKPNSILQDKTEQWAKESMVCGMLVYNRNLQCAGKCYNHKPSRYIINTTIETQRQNSKDHAKGLPPPPNNGFGCQINTCSERNTVKHTLLPH